MARTNPANPKEQVLAAFQQLVEKQRLLASKIVTNEELAERAKDREVVKVASGYTIETIIKGLAELQLDFGGSVETLTKRLQEDSVKLEELRRAIRVETERLENLEELRTAADALNILKQENRDALRVFEEQARERTETLDAEVARARAQWADEVKAYEAAVRKYEERLATTRKKAEADYDYELARTRKVEADAFEEKKRMRLRAATEEDTRRNTNWAEREALLASRKADYELHQKKIDAAPQEIEDAAKKAREDAIRETLADAKIRADLMEKEIEANRKVAALQIQSLEATLAKQTEQIDTLTAQLQAAVKQTQELAHKAVEGTSRRHEPAHS
jgi:hypothetical protein